MDNIASNRNTIFYYYIFNAFRKGSQVDVIYIDFAKAFNCESQSPFICIRGARLWLPTAWLDLFIFVKQTSMGQTIWL